MKMEEKKQVIKAKKAAIKAKERLEESKVDENPDVAPSTSNDDLGDENGETDVPAMDTVDDNENQPDMSEEEDEAEMTPDLEDDEPK